MVGNRHQGWEEINNEPKWASILESYCSARWMRSSSLQERKETIGGSAAQRIVGGVRKLVGLIDGKINQCPPSK